MTELKRCPFCGGKAKVYERKIDWLTDEYIVSCNKCDCRTGMYRIKIEAIEAWNKRVNDAHRQGCS